MQISCITDFLEAWASPSLAESYDNPGLLVGSSRDSVKGILVCLDVTNSVIEEAVSLDANLIIAHHPIWFGPRFRITDDDPVGELLLKAIRLGISIYAIHTNLDNVQTGVNARICEKIGLVNTRILKPRPNQPTIGSGMIGEFPESISKLRFLELLEKRFETQQIRYADCIQTQIQSVAVCGGAGSFLIADALAAKADAFITADVTYHKFFEPNGKLLLVDIGHYESEQFTSDLITEQLCQEFTQIPVFKTQINTNPIICNFPWKEQ
ncbi:MAG: Nif3-like dinuclear metal center hexameric protein [Bacteroidia bacterium]|nr:Nif3-like dinuclear metal center hexameric protein [Bacteroidia bacterium]